MRTTFNYINEYSTSSTMIIESTETTTEEVVALARKCTEEILEKNLREFDWKTWRMLFNRSLPKDCKIVEEIVTL